MKKLLSIIALAFLSACTCDKKCDVTPFTEVCIRNFSTEDSVKVYVTMQSTDSVMGLFGIKDTIAHSKGFFYAKKGEFYYAGRSTALLGVVVSFLGDNLPCQVAIQQGFPTGINVFEFSVNTAYEVFDISCEDGVNSIIKVSVNDTNWTTGDSIYEQRFSSAQNKFPIDSNLNIRGVFPYRCTDCIDLGTAVPQNCFNLKDTCNSFRACQVARTNHIGGQVLIEYVSKTK